MKTSPPDKRCLLCAGELQPDAPRQEPLCHSCQHAREMLRENPQSLSDLCRLAGISLPGQDPCRPEQELPDVLDAVRYRTTDRERNTWYVSVSELHGEPVEIFASTAFDRDQHLQSRISNLTTITRLISLILRHIFMGERLTLEKTLTQLRRSSRQTNDLPDMLGNVLANYSKQPQPMTDRDRAVT